MESRNPVLSSFVLQPFILGGDSVQAAAFNVSSKLSEAISAALLPTNTGSSALEEAHLSVALQDLPERFDPRQYNFLVSLSLLPSC